MAKNDIPLKTILVVIIVALFVYFIFKNIPGKGENFSRKSSIREEEVEDREDNSIERFTALAAGAGNNSGILLDDSYDLIPGADDGIPAHHFADMVNKGNLPSEFVQQPQDLGENMRPQERLHKIQGKSLMPRTSTYVTPYNVDVATPTSVSYMVNTPRVTTGLKSKFKDYSMSNFIRGDIPITYHPNICYIAKTVQGRDDLRLDGLFSPYNAALYAKYTGKAYKNLVQQTAGAGQAGGYGGASGGTLMDNY